MARVLQTCIVSGNFWFLSLYQQRRSFSGDELILSGNTLYGTASNGGSSGNGTVFSISIPVPQNQSPVVANPIPDQTNTYGNAFNYTFPANTFSDPDFGQTLAYTASNLPPGIIFDGSSRTFSGTNTDVGSYDVTVTATDDGLPPLSANDVFNITVGKAVLTATASDQTNSYGAYISLNPYFDIAYSGFKFPWRICVQPANTAKHPNHRHRHQSSGGLSNHIEWWQLIRIIVLCSKAVS